ncbi:hypothetical protein ACJQ42_000265 [Enterococcus faecalis]|uniref:hypothetical protein n=1 Tax=Enterococcus sp. C22 TaxID=3231289 RepID=UPI00349FE9C7
MKFSFEKVTSLAPEQVWHNYEQIDNWYKWEDDLEELSLEGDFVEGSKGVMKLTGMPAMEYTLVSVKHNQEFVDKTVVPEVGDIYFYHELHRIKGETLIRHSVEFIPQNRSETVEDTEFVSQIFSDVPESVFKLIEASKNE